MSRSDPQPSPRTPEGQINRKRVVVWMTIGVIVTLLVMTFVLLGAVPPWPVWLFFALSHGFFCLMIWRARPYTGPYQDPMPEVSVSAPRSESNPTP